jgi:hypothetical protein
LGIKSLEEDLPGKVLELEEGNSRLQAKLRELALKVKE